MRKYLLSFLAIVLSALSCHAPARAESPVFPVVDDLLDLPRWADEPLARNYCSMEGMLSRRGEPPLLGPVKSVRVTQYAVTAGARGKPAMARPASILQNVTLVYTREGTLAEMERLAYRGGKPEGEKADAENILYFRGRYSPDVKEIWPFADTDPYLSLTTRDASGRVLREELWRNGKLVRTEAVCTHNGRESVCVNSLDQRTVTLRDETGRPVRMAVSMLIQAPERLADSFEDGPSVLPDAPEHLWSKAFLVYSAEYGDDGRPLRYREEDSSSSPPSAVDIRWFYDDTGRLLRAERHRAGSVTESATEIRVWDERGNLALFEDQMLLVRYTRDAQGHVTRIDRTDKEYAGPTEEIARFSKDGQGVEETILFTNDANGNWVRAELQSPMRPAIIERTIEYYRPIERNDE